MAGEISVVIGLEVTGIQDGETLMDHTFGFTGDAHTVCKILDDYSVRGFVWNQIVALVKCAEMTRAERECASNKEGS